MSILLTRRAVVQANLESVYNTLVAVDNTDGVLSETPDFNITPNILERDFTHPDIGMLPFIIGRKIAKMEFTTELRSNGKTGSGVLGNQPVITRLFQACGFSITGNTSSFVIGPYTMSNGGTPVSWAISSQATATGVLTATGEPANNDTVTIGTITYTFQTTLTNTANNVLIGGSEGQALLNLAAAISKSTGAGTTYGMGTISNPYVNVTGTTGTTLSVQADSPGSVANTTALSKSSSVLSWGHTTLTGGTSAGTNTDVVAYYIAVTTPGPSGTAMVTITSDTEGEGSDPQTITSGMSISLGSQGLTLTPTFSVGLGTNQLWSLWLMPPGETLQPVSQDFSSISLYMNKDGVMHTMPGALGTFEITAEAGDYAKVKWTFTGTYVEPFDQDLDFPNYETELPAQVELARLMAGGFNCIVDKFTLNMGNDIQPRMDVSSSDGYNGVRLVSRKPEGGIDPEADNVANYDFWGRMSTAKRMTFQMRAGTQSGNTVWMLGTNVQYSGLTYQDRNGILTYQGGLRFARQAGDDEVFFHFM